MPSGSSRRAPGSRPRQAAAAVAAGLLLIGPTALAFFAGGYFDEPRAWAGLGCWAAVALALAAGAPLPRGRPAAAALGGLALLAGWTLLSIRWAPIAGTAYHAGQIAVLYTGALLGSVLIVRGGARRAVEPLLAAGTVVVVGYGLSERLLPGLLHFARSVSAEGRLEQPLTYWNAMGELAALGIVLCARIAGDRARPAAMRAAAAAAAAPLGMGLYISFSRGALFACGAGLLALVVIAPRREQLGAVLRALVAGALGALGAAPFPGVTGLAGSPGTRERPGAIVLGLLVVIAALAALAASAAVGRAVGPAGPVGRPVRRGREREGDLSLPPRAGLIAAVVVGGGLALAILVGAHESGGATQSLSGGANRLTSLQSNRFDYWSVAFRAFAGSPLHGAGAGGWAVDWLRWRTVGEYAQDAHSLEIQTLAELGVIGLGLLAVFIGGVIAAARRALGAGAAAAGPVAALVTYLAHSPLDWDWQMPAVTLVAIVLAGAVIADAGEAGEAGANSRGSRPHPEPRPAI